MTFPTFKLSFTGGSIVCSGENGGDDRASFETTARSDSYFNRLGAEIMRQSWAFTTEGPQIAIESHIVTQRDVPVLYCYPKDAEQLPVVFFNHGSSGEALGNLSMGIELAQAGFFAVLVDSRLHGRRRMAQFNEKFSNRGTYKRMYLNMLLETADDISAVIDHLGADGRADTQRVGISGISQGGFVSFVTITKDKRIKAAAPLVASPDLEGTWGHSPSFELLEDDLKADIIRHSPLRKHALIPPVALLVQNGNADTIVPVDGVRNLDILLKELYKDMPERYRYIEYDGQGHDIRIEGGKNPDIMKDEVIAWFLRFL